ncbi:MAG: hypothetical protein ACRDS1_15595 [Pseudonocardiaceae bacterium]
MSLRTVVNTNGGDKTPRYIAGNHNQTVLRHIVANHNQTVLR